MRIEGYFLQIQKVVESCSVIQLSNVTYDKRGTHEGFIQGKLQFMDGSILHWREFVDVEITADRLMYVYQYMDSSDMIVFRYDNTGHHKKLNLSTYPHHKHEGSDNNVVPSAAKDLANVLKEIELLFKF
ncbi:MAG: hypothetical protein HKUEN01_05540 [Candidatus Kuenenia stuttgartiensis]|nr:MAG: hypothetical protein HKUEN01_05540 [Candidatus Kuenenia stuttgartiensis]